MRLQPAFMSLAICLLTGCALFSHRTPTSRLASVSVVELQSLSIGDWCRVRLTDIRVGLKETRTEYIGQVQQISGDSVTLSKVTTHRRIEVSIIPGIPHVKIDRQDESSPITLLRDRLMHIESLSPAQAAESKQPYERLQMQVHQTDDEHNQIQSR